MGLSYEETEQIQDEVDRIDARFVRNAVSGDYVLEFCARVVGMYIVGGRRFGLLDKHMFANVTARAKEFADAFISEVKDVS